VGIDPVKTINVTVEMLMRGVGDTGWAPYVPPYRVDAAIKVARERFGVCNTKLNVTNELGLQVNALKNVFAHPDSRKRGVKVSNFGVSNQLAIPTPDENIVFGAFPDANPNDVKVLIVPIMRRPQDTDFVAQLKGVAYVSSEVKNPAWANYVLVSGSGLPVDEPDPVNPDQRLIGGQGAVFAHEIAHLLWPNPTDAFPNHQVYRTRTMYAYGSDKEHLTVNIRKRFSTGECNNFRQSPLMQ
jgi:hypothetical protein